MYALELPDSIAFVKNNSFWKSEIRKLTFYKSSNPAEYICIENEAFRNCMLTEIHSETCVSLDYRVGNLVMDYRVGNLVIIDAPIVYLSRDALYCTDIRELTFADNATIENLNDLYQLKKLIFLGDIKRIIAQRDLHDDETWKRLATLKIVCSKDSNVVEMIGLNDNIRFFDETDDMPKDTVLKVRTKHDGNTEVIHLATGTKTEMEYCLNELNRIIEKVTDKIPTLTTVSVMQYGMERRLAKMSVLPANVSVMRRRQIFEHIVNTVDELKYPCFYEVESFFIETIS